MNYIGIHPKHSSYARIRKPVTLSELKKGKHCVRKEKVTFMNDSDLTAFENYQLQYLKTEVKRKQDDVNRRDSFSGADNALFLAQKELSEFLSSLRLAGKNI
tara:strand:- start:295 stop:600 length:306 start_codon:yes stop_codon:yes gene_type:complete